MPQQQLSVITHSIIVSRILYALPAWGGFWGVELKNRINAFFKRLRRFGYINCAMTIDDLIGHSDYERFTKVCSGSHSLYHLLPPYRTSDLRLRGHPFQLPDYYTNLHKNRSLFDICMNILNKIIYWYWVVLLILCFYCFCVFPMCSIAIVLMCVSMRVCRIVIKITYSLTYL